MSPRIFNAPPGLDYDPVTGAHAQLSFGVVSVGAARGNVSTLAHVVAKRLFPGTRPGTRNMNWVAATAKPWEVLLPPGAPSSMWDVGTLCDAYHEVEPRPIEHLAAVVTLRWPEVENVEVGLPIHEAWECSRNFALELTRRCSVAAVAACHIPARAWSQGAPHVHLVLPCRTVRPGTGFASFCKPLTTPVEGRNLIDDLWSAHIEKFPFSRRLDR